MSISKKLFTAGAVLAAAFSFSAHAALIYVVDAGVSGHGQVAAAKSHLTGLGHTVSAGGTLGSYAGFDQVWDLRYNAALTGADITAMGAFLQSGGRMYLTGEHSGFATRNNSIAPWVAGVGGGGMTVNSDAVSGSQALTAAALAVGLGSSPNAFASIGFGAANTSTAGSLTQAFLATDAGNGTGSLVGWDFGDISAAPSARMLIGFDIEIFQNGSSWTENMYTYLAANAGPGVPEPGALLMAATALLLLGATARRGSSAR